MKNRRLLLITVIFIVFASLMGCKKKKADACADPNCKDINCAVPGQKTETVTTKRELEPQTICPIMGATIDKALFVEKNNMRIYVSEESAKQEVATNFEKYVEELKGMGQKPETIK